MVVPVPDLVINDTTYQLAATLRVAYKWQGQNNNKPYLKVFEEMSDMGVEKQIDMLYASFICANPQEERTWTQQKFREYCFDNMNLGDLGDMLNQIIRSIMGDKMSVTDDTAAVANDAQSEEEVKN